MLNRLLLKQLIIFTFFDINRRKYYFIANFHFRFLIDLHVLGCPEYDLTMRHSLGLRASKFQHAATSKYN